MLSGVDARTIRVVPLRWGNPPDLSKGKTITTSASCAADPATPPFLGILHDGDFIAVWKGEEMWCHSRFAWVPRQWFVETPLGEWPAGYVGIGAHLQGGVTEVQSEYNTFTPADLNGDGIDDLVLRTDVPRGSTGLIEVFYRVALGTPDGSFDFSSPPVRLGADYRIFANVGDMDGDGLIDLIYHQLPSGGYNPNVDVVMLRGHGDGTFDETPARLFTTSDTPRNLSVGDFNEDGLMDVLVGVDDDVNDRGQAYIAINLGGLAFEVVQSVDFDPSEEGPTADVLRVAAGCSDLNLDGHLDALGYVDTEQDRVALFPGKGTGQFGSEQIIFSYASGPVELDYPPCF